MIGIQPLNKDYKYCHIIITSNLDVYTIL